MDSDLVQSLAFGWIWLGAFAQLIGMPIAWLRLRHTTEWREREGRRRIDILALALRVPTALTILWGYLALVMVAAVGGSDGPSVAYLAFVLGPPLVFVPLMAWTTAQVVRG